MYGGKQGSGIYVTMLPLIAEMYAGAMSFEDKWVRVVLLVRVHPNFKDNGGFSAAMT